MGQGRVTLARLVDAQTRLSHLPGDLEETLRAVADEAAAMFGEFALVALVSGEDVVARAVAGHGPAVAEGDRLSRQGTLAGLVLATGEPTVCDDGYDDPRTSAQTNRRVGIRSSVVVPIRHEGEVLGLLMLASSGVARFDTDDRDALTLLAAMAGGAVATAAARRERTSVQSALTASLRRLEAASEVSGAGTWEWDLATGALTWSEQMYRIAGTRPGEFTPTIDSWTELLHPVDREHATGLRSESMVSGHGYRERFRIVDLTGRVRRLLAWSEVEVDDTGTPVRVVGATLDSSDAEAPAGTDLLTELPDRAVLDERLADAAAAAGPGRCVGLLLLDLDRFRLVNETLGRDGGDRVLAATASRVITACPAGSTVVRTSGDEFAVLVPAVADRGGLSALADRLVASSREPYRSHDVPDGTVCTAAVGLALTHSPHRDPGDLVREADLALHRAKVAGGDRWVVFAEAMSAEAVARVRTEEALRAALDDGRLDVVYQPVVCLRTGRVLSVEALARVVDPALGPLSPALFVEVAEQTGLVTRLDTWVVRHAVAVAAGWEQVGHPPLQVSVNLSPRTLRDGAVDATVAAALAEAGLPGSRLRVEITEHTAAHRDGLDDDDAGPLHRLRRLGVHVGIDDFGTGWSSMAYLAGMDLQFLKLDRGFVFRLGEEPAAEAVVRAVVELGHAYGLSVVGEGVETERQAQLLRDLGCDQAQGWWVGRPVPAERLPDALATWAGRAAGIRWAGWGEPGVTAGGGSTPAGPPPSRW